MFENPLLRSFATVSSGTPKFAHRVYNDVNRISQTRKRRLIWEPNPAMRLVHSRLLGYLRIFTGQLEHATGALPGTSPLRHISRHRGRRFLYTIDIKSAYQGVDGEKLADVLCGTIKALQDGRQEVLRFLKKHCLVSVKHGLVTGAPASPDLFNLYAGKLIDQPLSEYCRKHGIIYGRYLDDLLFSADGPIGVKKRKMIRSIIEAAGFGINHRKAGVFDLAKGPVAINGIGLDLSGRIFLPRHYLRKIKGAIHRAATRQDIQPGKIHGLMGVLSQITPKYDRNRTEAKVFGDYNDYRWKFGGSRGK